jgi:hypothetical protein
MRPILLLTTLALTTLVRSTPVVAEDAPTPEKPQRVRNAASPNNLGGEPETLRLRAFVPASQTGQGQHKTAPKESPPPLIIEFSGSSDRKSSALTEDLSIMAHLLERDLERSVGAGAPDIKMGVPIILNASTPSVRAMYLDGFGALFLAKVNFPLMGPRKLEEKMSEPPLGSEWEDVKRELGNEPGNGWDATESYLIGGDYDEERIEALQSALFESLRNATNIRNLKSDESVAVTVFGTPAPIQVPGRTGKAKTGRSAKNDAAALRELSRSAAGRRLAANARQGTVMTIRVKKSEVDSFAKAKLNLQEFQRRSTTTFYFGSGHSAQSLNTWSQIGANYGRFTP